MFSLAKSLDNILNTYTNAISTKYHIPKDELVSLLEKVVETNFKPKPAYKNKCPPTIYTENFEKKEAVISPPVEIEENKDKTVDIDVLITSLEKKEEPKKKESPGKKKKKKAKREFKRCPYKPKKGKNEGILCNKKIYDNEKEFCSIHRPKKNKKTKEMKKVCKVSVPIKLEKKNSYDDINEEILTDEEERKSVGKESDTESLPSIDLEEVKTKNVEDIIGLLKEVDLLEE